MKSAFSKSTHSALLDMAENIRLACQFIAGMNYADFQHDRRTTYAVTRCLEIISEASRRLPDETKARHVDIPWSDIAGAGNVYRHDYEDVREQMLWRTVQQSLPRLLAIVESELSRLPEE